MEIAINGGSAAEEFNLHIEQNVEITLANAVIEPGAGSSLTSDNDNTGSAFLADLIFTIDVTTKQGSVKLGTL